MFVLMETVILSHVGYIRPLSVESTLRYRDPPSTPSLFTHSTSSPILLPQVGFIDVNREVTFSLFGMQYNVTPKFLNCTTVSPHIGVPHALCFRTLSSNYLIGIPEDRTALIGDFIVHLPATGYTKDRRRSSANIFTTHCE